MLLLPLAVVDLSSGFEALKEWKSYPIKVAFNTASASEAHHFNDSIPVPAENEQLRQCRHDVHEELDKVQGRYLGLGQCKIPENEESIPLSQPTFSSTHRDQLEPDETDEERANHKVDQQNGREEVLQPVAKVDDFIVQLDDPWQVLVLLQAAYLLVQQLDPATGGREEGAEEAVLAEHGCDHSESTERRVNVGEEVGHTMIGIVWEQHGIWEGADSVVEKDTLSDINCVCLGGGGVKEILENGQNYVNADEGELQK